MKQNESSLTSLVSAFSRAYHVKHDTPIIFNDTFAHNFLSNEEYDAISQNMVQMAATSGEAMHFCSSIAQLELLLAQRKVKWHYRALTRFQFMFMYYKKTTNAVNSTFVVFFCEK